MKTPWTGDHVSREDLEELEEQSKSGWKALLVLFVLAVRARTQPAVAAERAVPKLFYGYWIVAVGFLCLLIQAGCGFYAFSLFVRTLQADFGWGRGEIMAAFTMLYLIQGLASPFSGRLVDRYGAKRVITIGALIMGLGFVWLSQINSLWHFYIGYAVIGVGAAGTGTVPASAVVSNWFKKRRGMAVGIMAAGIGTGGFALAPLVGNFLLPNFGWRTSYFALALIVWAVIIPLALLVIKTRPADKGLYPDGMKAPAVADVNKASLSAPEGLTLKMASATSTFWIIAICSLLTGFSLFGIVLTQVPYLEDVGFSIALASIALGITALVSAAGKLGFGWLCDQIHPKYVWAISLVLQMAGIGILMSVGPASPVAMIWIYTIVMGLGGGAWLPTMSILISSNFGLGSYGTIFGVVIMIQCVGFATGPLMAGFVYDVMNTYHWAFIIFLACYAVALPAVLVLRRPKSLRDFKGAF